MRIIERWECPTCGRAHTNWDSEVCGGVLQVAEHKPVGWVKVEYVPAERLAGAVEALGEIEDDLAALATSTRRWNPEAPGAIAHALQVAREALAAFGGQ